MDLPELEEVDLSLLSEQELAMVLFDTWFWQCRIIDCKCKTKVKVFGDYHSFLWRKTWIKFHHHYFLCGKHSKIYNKKVPENEIPFRSYWGYDETEKLIY